MSVRFDRLSLLETFVRVAERGSLSAAARDLDVSQPSVSRQLAALETRLGATLLRRTTHASSLTADGRALLDDARRLVGEWEAIEERHANAAAGPRGLLRVVAPVGLGQGRLARAAVAFLAAHPDVSIEWRITDAPIRFAEEGCDCWIRVGAVPDETLVVRELARVERLVVGTADLVERHAGAALDALPWLALGPFEGSRIELRDERGAGRAFEVRPRLATDSVVALREAVLGGLGVAILPRWFVEEELAAGTLVDVAPGLRARRLPVLLATASGVARPARVTAFADAMIEWGHARFDPVA